MAGVRLAALIVVAVVVWHQWSRSSATVRKLGGPLIRKVSSPRRWTSSTPAPSRSRRRSRDGASVAGRAVAVGAVAVADRGGGRRLCRTGGLRVWSSAEDVVIVVGGPRTGKTGWLAGQVLSIPFVVVCLTLAIRLDPYRSAGAVRAGTSWAGPGVPCSSPARTRRPGVVDHLRPADRLHGRGDRDRAGHGRSRAVSRFRNWGSGVLGRSGPSRASRVAARRRSRRQADAGRAGAGWLTRIWPAGTFRRCCGGRGVQAFEQDAMQFITATTAPA
ncbi:hypothetical protein HBB16_14115 [Pseudonocardia sp. MCCB 268]|nr:hypothetical protein [Pseudonocardia cytotoxica]